MTPWRSRLNEFMDCGNTGTQTVCTTSKVTDELGCYAESVLDLKEIWREDSSSRKSPKLTRVPLCARAMRVPSMDDMRLSGLPTLGARSAVAAVTNSHFTRHCVEVVVVENFGYEGRIFSNKLENGRRRNSYACGILPQCCSACSANK